MDILNTEDTKKDTEFPIPKYSIGLSVWFIEENKACLKTIRQIACLLKDKYHPEQGNEIRYNFSETPREYDWKREIYLFISKEELLASL